MKKPQFVRDHTDQISGSNAQSYHGQQFGAPSMAESGNYAQARPLPKHMPLRQFGW